MIYKLSNSHFISENRQFIRFLKYAFALSIFTLLYSCSDEIEETPANPLNLNLSNFKNCRSSFSINKLSETHIDGSTLLFRLTADSAMDRPRSGEMVLFRNYYEIYLNNMVLDQPLKERFARLDMTSFDKAIRSLDDGNDEAKPAKSNVLDFTECSLNRVLVDGVKINITPPNQSPIVLMAGRAKMGMDTTLIKFEQNVNLDAVKCKLSSQTAIWSNKYSGIFFPNTYVMNGITHKKGDFFQITKRGKCVKVLPTPSVEYLDMLDEVENNLSIQVPFIKGFGF